MDELFSEMIDTLREADRTVRDDLERQSKSSGEDPDSLMRLEEAVRNFAEQADGLLNMMIERDPLNPKIEEAEDLLDFFRQTEIRVAVMLEAGEE